MINLIPIAYLNEACFLSLNTDDKKYQMCLKISQDTLEEILGTEFYNEIETQYDNDNLTADNDALYDPFIKDYVAWLTYLNYLKFANADNTPTGVREFSDENSSIVNDVKMYGIEKNVRGMVDFYKGKMLNFLKLEQYKDGSKYPLYKESCKTDFGFAITSIDKKSDVLIKVNKAIITNE